MSNGGADGGAEMAKRQLHKLSAREAETLVEPGRHSDGGGLYLVIEAGAHGRQWIFLYRARGTSKRKELGLGAAKGKGKDGLSLADARLKAADTPAEDSRRTRAGEDSEDRPNKRSRFYSVSRRRFAPRPIKT